MAEVALLYDRIIDLELYYTDKQDDSGKGRNKVLKIHCPRQGKKPAITFSYSRVPGNFTYSCTITITNMYMTIEAARVKTIRVTCGYNSINSEITSTFTCQIFASYRPTPGPDGTTVFESIVASADNDLFSQRAVKLTVYNNSKHKPTVREVLETSFDAEHLQMKPILRLSEGLLDSQFSQVDCSVFSTTGYRFITELQTRLTSNIDSDKGFINVSIFDDSVCFTEYEYILEKKKDKDGNEIEVKVGAEVSKNIKQDDSKLKLHTIKLTNLTSVDWNAGVVTISAPFTPQVKPSSYIKLDTKYFTGGKGLPNDLQLLGTHLDEYKIYQVITQSVNFSTTDDINTMEIMAVPYKSVSVVQNSTLDTQTQQQAIDELNAKYYFSNEEYTNKIMKQQVLPINVGTQDKDNEGTELISDLSELMLNMTVTEYRISKGDTLSQLADKTFEKSLEGTVGGRPLSCAANIAGSIVIRVLTNSKAKATENTRHYDMHFTAPNDLDVDKYLCLPAEFKGWKSWQQSGYKSQLVQAFNLASTYYAGASGTESWAVALSNAAKLMNEGVLNG